MQNARDQTLVRLTTDSAELKRDLIYERLLHDIICRRVAPGSRIDEALVAERYDAGRAGVRDALYRLSLEGLVTRRPRLGTFVTELSIFELQQVFELRVQLEGQCAALAAEAASADEVRVIEDAFQDVEDIIAQRDFDALVKMDQVFHQAIAGASHNRWLLRMVTMLHNNASRFWHFALPRRSMNALRAEIDFHLKVAAAIRSRHPDKARQSMEAVLRQFPSTITELLAAPAENNRH